MMKKTQWWQKYVLIVCIFAFVALLGFMILNTFVWKSFETRQISAINEKAALQEKLEDAKKADALIEQLTKQIEKLIGGNEGEKEKLSKGIDIPDLLRELEKASIKSGFEVSGIELDGTGNYVKRPAISVSTSEGTVNIYNIGLSMNVNGTYEAMQTFIKSFEDSGYYVTVQSIEVDRQDTLINQDIVGSIRIVIYSSTSGGIKAGEIGQIVENNTEKTDEKTDEKVENTSDIIESNTSENTSDITESSTSENNTAESNVSENNTSENNTAESNTSESTSTGADVSEILNG